MSGSMNATFSHVTPQVPCAIVYCFKQCAMACHPSCCRNRFIDHTLPLCPATHLFRGYDVRNHQNCLKRSLVRRMKPHMRRLIWPNFSELKEQVNFLFKHGTQSAISKQMITMVLILFSFLMLFLCIIVLICGFIANQKQKHRHTKDNAYRQDVVSLYPEGC